MRNLKNNHGTRDRLKRNSNGHCRKPGRIEDAILIRDAALAVVQESGWFEETNIGPMPSWSGGDLHISYRTPFQKLPPLKPATIRKCHNLGLSTAMNLPYGLDIWDRKSGGKVLNIEWSDDGEVALVNFRRGAWEKGVLALRFAGGGCGTLLSCQHDDFAKNLREQISS